MAYRSPLGRLLPESMDVERIKREGWREDRILVVHLDDPRLDFVQREFVQQIGDALYGAPRTFTTRKEGPP